MTLLDNVRDVLVTQGIGRKPETAAVGTEPPIWRHPIDGPVAPGDSAEAGRPATAKDNGLVITLMHEGGEPPRLGMEELRVDRVQIVFRATSVPPIVAADAAVRALLVGTFPGGRCDWTMAGLYVVQATQWSALQPLGAGGGVWTFAAVYRFVTRAT